MSSFTKNSLDGTPENLHRYMEPTATFGKSFDNIWKIFHQKKFLNIDLLKSFDIMVPNLAQFPSSLEKSENCSLCNTSSLIDDLRCNTYHAKPFYDMCITLTPRCNQPNSKVHITKKSGRNVVNKLINSVQDNFMVVQYVIGETK